MPRKPTIRSLKKRLDRICSEKTRSRGYCVKCGSDNYKELDTAHIISRKHNSLRFEQDNLLCLCSSCHSRFHDNPLLFADFCREYLGEEKYQMLKIRGNEIKKWKLFELQELYTTLRAGTL